MDPPQSKTQTLPSRDQELVVGGLFADRYQVLEELGKGGMGRVFKVVDTKVRETIALKILDPVIAADTRMIERFKNEMSFARKISHRNVCRMYDLNEAGGAPFITMEYVAGEDLKSTIRRVGPLGVGKAILIARQVCEGLAEAHRLGVIHRDLKPQNIMLDKAGDAHIMDFGIARSLQGKGTTGPGVMIGTPEYMSPEQVDGEEADPRADLYALGIVLFEMVTGQVPFTGDSSFAIVYKQKHEAPPDPAVRNPQVPKDLGRVILRCLEKNRDRRYQSAESLMAELAGISERAAKPESPALKKKPTTAKAIPARSWRQKLVPPAIAVAALALAAALILFFLPESGPKVPLSLKYKQITFSGNARWPAVSPDGKFLAYAEPDDSVSSRVMVQDLAGGPPLEVFRGRRCEFLRWLPNGSELSIIGADSSNRTALILVPRLGGTARSVESGGGSGFVTWSPDGSRYASPQGAGIRIADKTTGAAETVLVKGAFAKLVDLDWSPAGDRFVFTTINDKREYALGTIRTDGSQQQNVIAGLFLIESPRWSARGDAVYYLRGREQSIDLWKVVVSAKTGAPTGPGSIILPGLPTHLSFSVTSDGKKLAYSHLFSIAHLWLAEIPASGEGRDVRTSALTKGTSFNQFPSVSPDGRQVAFVRVAGNTSDLFVLPLDGGAARQLTYLKSMNYGPAWSSDGREIAFISMEGEKSRIWKIASNGGQPVPLVADGVGGYSLSWNPGSRILFQTTGNRNVGMIDPVSGQADFLIKENVGGWLINPRYSPDGKKVAFFWNRSATRGIWSVSLENGVPGPVFPGVHLPVGWSQDGRWIYAANATGDTLEIIAINAEKGDSRVVLTVSVDPDSGQPNRNFISMTPDGRKIVYVIEKSLSDIRLIEDFDPGVR